MVGKVFVSGVAGFLGSHIAQHYLCRGTAEVAGIDNLLGGSLEHVPKATLFRSADCVQVADYRDLLHNADVVFHCAAAPYEGLSIFSPTVVYQHTLQSTVALATASIEAGVTRFVLCSSMARYGNGTPPFTEDDEPSPVDPYGLAKVAAEKFVANVGDIHGMEWAIAVPHNIYGERQRFNDPFRNVVSIMINRILQGKQPIVYGDGSQRRCFSYVADVVEPLAQMAERPSALHQVINVGPDSGAVSILDLAAMIADLMEFKLSPIFLPGRPREVPIAECSAAKARKILGYSPSWSLEDGLQRTIDYVRLHGPKQFEYHLPIEITTELTPAVWSERLM
jgi:UDP-glucose 4-epimerase